MTQELTHKEHLRRILLNAMEEVYPDPLLSEAVDRSLFDPNDPEILTILDALTEESLCEKNSVLKNENGQISWHKPVITTRGIEHLASHSNMSDTLKAGTQRVRNDCLLPLLKEALLLDETLSLEAKKTYLLRLKAASDSELAEIAKELEAKGIFKQSHAVF